MWRWLLTWWARNGCALVGHDPVGGEGVLYEVFDDDPALEPFVYRCQRCRRGIRFLKTYPNGWYAVEE